jgi:hypothetical protein
MSQLLMAFLAGGSARRHDAVPALVLRWLLLAALGWGWLRALEMLL